jgi:hypothetical protein
MIRFRFTLALTFVCLTVLAEEPLLKALPPAQEAAALQAAQVTGLAIYRHDHAAAVATDAVFKLDQFRKDERTRGWITEEQQDDITVTFIDQEPAALYRVTVNKDGVAGQVRVMDRPIALTSYEAGAAAARAAAVASPFQPCADKYNSVVLPSADGREKWAVYLIPGTIKKGIIPFGGAYRMGVSGKEVLSQRAFTRTCITLQANENAVGLMITHLLDPVPTEIHVFWSISTHQPIYVGTPPNGTVWAVEGGKIKLVERK